MGGGCFAGARPCSGRVSVCRCDLGTCEACTATSAAAILVRRAGPHPRVTHEASRGLAQIAPCSYSDRARARCAERSTRERPRPAARYYSSTSDVCLKRGRRTSPSTARRTLPCTSRSARHTVHGASGSTAFLARSSPSQVAPETRGPQNEDGGGPDETVTTSKPSTSSPSALQQRRVR